MVAAERRAQQKNCRTAGGEAVNHLKKQENFDCGLGCKFTTYLTWATQDTEKLGFSAKNSSETPLCSATPIGSGIMRRSRAARERIVQETGECCISASWECLSAYCGAWDRTIDQKN
jgi:hypothetical protein